MNTGLGLNELNPRKSAFIRGEKEFPCALCADRYAPGILRGGYTPSNAHPYLKRRSAGIPPSGDQINNVTGMNTD
jgi:hypothetical protein